MKPLRLERLRWALAALLAIGGGVPVLEGQNAPRIGYVYPAGGRQGTTFQVVVGGQFLNGATNVYVCGSDVEGTVLEYSKPLNPQQFNLLREQARELQQRRAAALQQRRRNAPPTGGTVTNWTATDERLLAELRAKMQKLAPKRNANPAIAETVTVRLTVGADAAIGERELRIRAQGGLSNPLRFWVDSLPECSKPEARLETGGGPRSRSGELSPAAAVDTGVRLPAILNGQILAGGVDRYRFQARRGQHLLANVKARALIPYLPDAVPGWFQAIVTLYDAAGRELAYAGHYRFAPDPLLHFEIPNDGEYALEIRDALYRGREDFVYRMTVGELPCVTSIFPLGGSAGKLTAVEVQGWNLPRTNLVFDAREKPEGVYPLSALQPQPAADTLRFAVGSLPETFDMEPNDTRDAAQTITPPIIINGRISRPGDSDWFRFEGHAGEEMVAEIHARRLGSPMDSVIELIDSTGKVLARNDDYEDRTQGLETHHADSWLRAVLPATASYWVQVRDTQQQGGPDVAYRLRISPPQPGFELRAVPASLSVRPGASVPLTVYALRKDGFTNAIDVLLKNPPPGVRLSGGTIPANQDQARLTISARASLVGDAVPLTLEGRALVQGRPIVAPALPAEDLMQAFAYHHLVVAKELRMTVVARPQPFAAVRVLTPTPVRIPAGGSTRVRLAMPGQRVLNQAHLELNDPPEGILLERVTALEGGVELVISGDDDLVRPGMKGNLMIAVVPGSPAPPETTPKPQVTARRRALGNLPAVPFEIVPE